MARHAKLEGTPPQLAKSLSSKFQLIQRFLEPIYRFFNVGDDYPLLKRLTSGATFFVLIFSVGTLFVPLHHYSGWAHAHYDGANEALELLALGDPPTDPLDSLLTEDGFLIKPAVHSSVGDRSEANQIFMYTVEPGDTLSTVAQEFGISKETLIMENELWDTPNLKSGMQLKLLPVDGVSHQVKSGETVTNLAQKYNVQAEDILRQNKMEEGDVLVADSSILIPGGKKERPVIKPAYTPPSRYASSSGSSAPGAPPPPGASAASGSGRFIWPTNDCGQMSRGYIPGHYALDIACRAKGPIYASAGGTVVKVHTGCGSRQSRCGGGYGNHIIVDHGGGVQTLYAHNEVLYVHVGDQVAQGQSIAWMGNTGNVSGITGIHLHFEIRINGVKQNPANFIAR